MIFYFFIFLFLFFELVRKGTVKAIKNNH